MKEKFRNNLFFQGPTQNCMHLLKNLIEKLSRKCLIPPFFLPAISAAVLLIFFRLTGVNLREIP